MSKGIDIQINKLVMLFTGKLWTGKNNQFYGRVFRNERFENFQSKVSPEVYISEKEPAKEVLKDYNFDSQCFFDVQPIDSVIADAHESTVWICFMVNLSKVYPTLTRTEATETAHRDSERLILDSKFDITGLTRGFAGFTDYDWGTDNSQAKADMYPHYCFKFITKIIYVNC